MMYKIVQAKLVDPETGVMVRPAKVVLTTNSLVELVTLVDGFEYSNYSSHVIESYCDDGSFFDSANLADWLMVNPN